MTSTLTSSSQRAPLCMQTQAIMLRSTGLFWSACAKNIPDKSWGKNLGQHWKDLIRTNVICRSMCGCVVEEVDSSHSPPVATQEDRSVSLCACVYVCVTPVWICRRVPVCLGDFTVKRDPVCATLDVCNGCAIGIGWSWPGAWGKPYWCEVWAPSPASKSGMETNLWDTGLHCGGTERPH